MIRRLPLPRLSRHLVSLSAVLALATGAAGCGAARARLGLPGGGASPAPAANPAADTPATSTSSTSAPAGAAAPAPSDHERQRELAFEYRQAIEGHTALIGNLARVAAGTWDNNNPDGAIYAFGKVDGLADLAAGCKAKFAAAKTLPYVDSADRQPQVVCPLVERRAELARQGLEITARAAVAAEVGSIARTLKALEAGEWVPEHDLNDVLTFATDAQPAITRAREKVAPLYAQLGTDPPAELFAGFAALQPTVGAALDASAAKVAIGRAESKDAAIEREARALLGKAKYGGEPLRIKTVHVAWRDWKIFTRDSGIPWYRIKMALALVQAKGEKHCRVYAVEARQEYAGGGTWNRGVVAEVVRGPQVARCK